MASRATVIRGRSIGLSSSRISSSASGLENRPKDWQRESLGRLFCRSGYRTRPQKNTHGLPGPPLAVTIRKATVCQVFIGAARVKGGAGLHADDPGRPHFHIDKL